MGNDCVFLFLHFTNYNRHLVEKMTVIQKVLVPDRNNTYLRYINFFDNLFGLWSLELRVGLVGQEFLFNDSFKNLVFNEI